MIRYFDKATDVQLGDVVTYKDGPLGKWKAGRISYLPGVSPLHPEMEHSGLCWAGVSGEDGTFRGSLVDPDTQCLPKSVRFCERSSKGGYLTPFEIAEDQW